MKPLSIAEFDVEVSAALDLLPPALATLMDNVAIFTEDRHRDDPDLLGLYEGVPLTERDGYGLMDLPDRVTVYRLPLCEQCADRDELIDEIQITVIHEVAHHFGIDDDRLEELGWD
jgi:predicted Zn-dependent protease with MMP-like domain